MIKLKDIIEGKFDPHHRDMWFVRYGGLSSKKQLGYDPHNLSPSFHSPPARHGIYAFPWPYIEPFLLGGDEYVNPKRKKKGQTLRIRYVKDKEGNPITRNHPDYTKLSAKGKTWVLGTHMDDDGTPTGGILYKNFGRKMFKYDGELWHHLVDQLSKGDVLAIKGSWVKSSMAAFRKALGKEIFAMNFNKKKYGMGTTKDHLEVFIENM